MNTLNHSAMMSIICPTIFMYELKYIWSFITTLIISDNEGRYIKIANILDIKIIHCLIYAGTWFIRGLIYTGT
jgi:hypothetical protein